MTGEKLVEIFGDYMEDTAGMNECVHAILAALESEREGEVVLWDSIVPFGIFDINYSKLAGKQGQLIFRPTKADKEDKKGGE